MAIIHQTGLFSWDEVEAASDLDRLRVLLEALPDEDLMRTLEAERKGRRDEYPLRAVWNSVLAGIVFQHVSVESLRRGLQRNAQLRQACGFDVFRGALAVPSWISGRPGRKNPTGPVLCIPNAWTRSSIRNKAKCSAGAGTARPTSAPHAPTTRTPHPDTILITSYR